MRGRVIAFLSLTRLHGRGPEPLYPPPFPLSHCLFLSFPHLSSPESSSRFVQPWRTLMMLCVSWVHQKLRSKEINLYISCKCQISLLRPRPIQGIKATVITWSWSGRSHKAATLAPPPVARQGTHHKPVFTLTILTRYVKLRLDSHTVYCIQSCDG